MKTAATALGLLLLASACAIPVSQGPVQQPVPIPKRSAGTRPEFPPSPRDREPPTQTAAEEPDPTAPERPGRPVASAPATEAPPAPVAEEAPSPARPDLLASVLWVQTAPEYQALALQAFQAARRSLDQALEEPRWNALAGSAEQLPPAVILDVDETVLDNSPYESRLILEGDEGSGGFSGWCLEERAEAIPGALDFTLYAASRGVAVYYVTNRNHDLEGATRNNLMKLGFPLGGEGEDRILTRYERAGWTSDKESRRREIAGGHRVVLLVGDDLNDFVSGGRGSRREREDLFQETRSRWGREWILLPNPMYGSWTRALTWGLDDELTAEQKLRLKLEQLKAAP